MHDSSDGVLLGLPVLHQLLNCPLVLKVLKADGSTALASATLDFGPLAQGLDQITAPSLKLTAADSQAALVSEAALTVKASKCSFCCCKMCL